MKNSHSKSASKSKAQKTTVQALISSFQSATIEENERIIQTLSSMSGKEPCYVARDLIESGMPTVLKKYRAIQMFRKMACVIHIKHQHRKQMALGFHEGKLTVCDGTRYTPVSVKESVQWYVKIYNSWMNSASDDHDVDEEALMRWHGMIAKAL